MLASKAYTFDEYLSNRIGPRLTGSEAYAKSVEWAVSEFKAEGLTNVHRESWTIRHTWEPEDGSTATLLKPYIRRIFLESDGWSPSTPPDGIRGDVYFLKTLSSQFLVAHASDVKGRVVLVDMRSFFTQDGYVYGQILDAVDLLAKGGASALVLGVGATSNVPSLFGLTCCSGRIAKLPVANLGSEDTQLLKTLLESGEVELQFSFRNRIRNNIPVENVVADIPGSDPSLGYVLLGAHLDSWHLGTGAQDDGTGVASVMAIAEAMQAAGIRPKRTMRFVLFGGEEQGMLGSIHYVQAHKVDLASCAGVFITDTGAEAPRGWLDFGNTDVRAFLATLDPLLRQVDANADVDGGGLAFSADVAPFLVQGVPSLMLRTSMEKYHLLHHGPNDTFDKVDERDLNLGTTVLGVTALAFANATGAISHLSQQQLEDQLKRAKAYDDYKDLAVHHVFDGGSENEQ